MESHLKSPCEQSREDRQPQLHTPFPWSMLVGLLLRNPPPACSKSKRKKNNRKTSRTGQTVWHNSVFPYGSRQGLWSHDALPQCSTAVLQAASLQRERRCCAGTLAVTAAPGHTAWGHTPATNFITAKVGTSAQHPPQLPLFLASQLTWQKEEQEASPWATTTIKSDITAVGDSNLAVLIYFRFLAAGLTRLAGWKRTCTQTLSHTARPEALQNFGSSQDFFKCLGLVTSTVRQEWSRGHLFSSPSTPCQTFIFQAVIKICSAGILVSGTEGDWGERNKPTEIRKERIDNRIWEGEGG